MRWWGRWAACETAAGGSGGAAAGGDAGGAAAAAAADGRGEGRLRAPSLRKLRPAAIRGLTEPPPGGRAAGGGRLRGPVLRPAAGGRPRRLRGLAGGRAVVVGLYPIVTSYSTAQPLYTKISDTFGGHFFNATLGCNARWAASGFWSGGPLSRGRWSHSDASSMGRDRASPKKSSPKTVLNMKTLYRESQKILIPHPRLVSPVTLGLALS